MFFGGFPNFVLFQYLQNTLEVSEYNDSLLHIIQFLFVNNSLFYSVRTKYSLPTPTHEPAAKHQAILIKFPNMYGFLTYS